MRNEYLAAERRYDKRKAKAYLAYVLISERFIKCQCKSMALKSLFLHYAEMPEKERAAAERAIRRELEKIPFEDVQNSEAFAVIHSCDDVVCVTFIVSEFDHVYYFEAGWNGNISIREL